MFLASKISKKLWTSSKQQNREPVKRVDCFSCFHLRQVGFTFWSGPYTLDLLKKWPENAWSRSWVPFTRWLQLITSRIWSNTGDPTGRTLEIRVNNEMVCSCPQEVSGMRHLVGTFNPTMCWDGLPRNQAPTLWSLYQDVHLSSRKRPEQLKSPQCFPWILHLT